MAARADRSEMAQDMNRAAPEIANEEEPEVDRTAHACAATDEAMREDVAAKETVVPSVQTKIAAVLDHIHRIERRRQLSQDKLDTNQHTKIDLDRHETDLNRPDTVRRDVTTIRLTPDRPHLS